MHESQLHPENAFITLTYSAECLPSPPSLSVRHAQLFMKKLRKAHRKKIRFVLCGEYGDQLHRPHYHALLFGTDFPDKTKHTVNAQGNTVYKSEALDKIWGLGHTYIGSVTLESAAYVARYALKKINGTRQDEHYKRVDLTTGELHDFKPEFFLMSRRPGIGKAWFDKYRSDVYPDDFIIMKGKKLRTPKYYDSQLDALILDEIKLQRRKDGLSRRDNNTPERLKVREEVQHARINTLQRPLEK